MSGRERKRQREKKRKGGRTACGIVVTFEPVRVTEWNGSSVDQRWVGTKGVAATANPARISPERGERVAGEVRRGDEVDGPNTRAFSWSHATRTRSRSDVAHTEEPGVIRIYVRESARMQPSRMDALTHTHAVSARAYGHTHVVRDAFACAGRKPAVRIDRARSQRAIRFFSFPRRC